MKGNVFTTPPASIEDMRDRIVNELANLREDAEMIKRVFRDMQRRAEFCIERGGRHVKDINQHCILICSQYFTLQ